MKSKSVSENIDLPATLSDAPLTVQIPSEMPAPDTSLEYSPRKRVTPSKEKLLQTSKNFFCNIKNDILSTSIMF